ncbi:MAG TPA: hypothetical protein VHE61_13475, partial [Opitutaceae bacterium]|nr:hypothetical protein [Opitutaceae bacterium]
MRRFFQIALAAYQVIGPVVGLVTMSSTLQSLGLGFFGVFLLFCGLSFAAGVALLFRGRTGWMLSLVNQAVQTIGVFSFPFT